MASRNLRLTIALLSTCLATTCLNALHAQSTATAPPLVLGTAWYPEQWPESRWDADLDLMQKAGIRMVRVGEFAWSRMEPSEGRYDLDWLDHAIAAAGRHGIYTVLGTPGAAPPAWLTQKYPQTLRTLEDGRKDQHGNREQFDWSDPRYRELTRAMAEQLAQRFGHNPWVLGWQIDNEYANLSYGDSTRAQFQAWLKARYGTLDNLNARWTTAYWSEPTSPGTRSPSRRSTATPASCSAGCASSPTPGAATRRINWMCCGPISTRGNSSPPT